MTPQTKHHLIVGGGLVVAVVVAIIVYKKYEAQSGGTQSASQAAADQQNQDALAYLEASSLNSPYAYDTSGAGGGVSLPSSPSSTNAAQSIADELASIEQAFGFAPPAPSSPAPTPTPAPAAAPSAPVSSSGTSSVPLPVSPASQRHALSDEPATLRLESEAFV